MVSGVYVLSFLLDFLGGLYYSVDIGVERLRFPDLIELVELQLKYRVHIITYHTAKATNWRWLTGDVMVDGNEVQLLSLEKKIDDIRSGPASLAIGVRLVLDSPTP